MTGTPDFAGYRASPIRVEGRGSRDESNFLSPLVPAPCTERSEFSPTAKQARRSVPSPRPSALAPRPSAELPAAILLMGPTASGKTGVALELARRLPVEIISVDSAQVYRDMNIGTAKPDLETRSQV